MSQVFGLGSFGVVVRARLSFVFSVVVLVYSYQGGNKNITSCSKRTCLLRTSYLRFVASVRYDFVLRFAGLKGKPFSKALSVCDAKA